MQQPPEFLGTKARQRVFDLHGAAQSRRIGGAVRALHPLPSLIQLCVQLISP
jgi:hypothetical protein